MRPTRTTRTLASWIALLAILLATFAPSVSQALAASKTPLFLEVCAATGATWVQADAGTDHAPNQGLLHHMEHCPFCSLHAHAPVLPSPEVTAPLVAATGGDVPQAFLSAPQTAHAWVAARPRAPPRSA